MPRTFKEGERKRDVNKECQCMDCGVLFLAARSDAKRCATCYEKRDRSHRQRPRPERILGLRAFVCADCHAIFYAGKVTQRCDECQRLRRNALMAEGERRKRKPCVDCGVLVYRNTALRCHSCEGKRRSQQGLQRGPNNNSWKGGRIRHQGYIHIRNPDPYTRPRYIGEHILVWAAANGPVPPKWDVHHFNGVKDDNRLENLFAMSKSQHHSNHHAHYEQRIFVLEARIRELEGTLQAEPA